jgi:hypothetical protein
VLHRDVYLRCTVVAHEECRETDADAFICERADSSSGLGTPHSRRFLACQQSCCHYDLREGA